MKNVYQIRNTEGDFYVLPTRCKQEEIRNPNRIGIIIYLYYYEDVQKYLAYIKKIPQGIDIMIISSNDDVLRCVKQNDSFDRELKVICKPNRGRDVSALLITAKDFVLSHEYIAFLHDKKEKNKFYYNDTSMWTHSMWENTINGKEYIGSVISLLDRNSSIGLALPIIDIGDYMMLGFLPPEDGWSVNYENTKHLSEELHLNCEIREDYPPISYGTMFWCRTQALKKLFDRSWRFEDFQEEPMDDDGTISHAIERILPYVAQDAGYKTCMIMNDIFAGSYLGKLHAMMDEFWKNTREEMGILYPYQIFEYEDRERIARFCRENPHVYIYGAGKVGKACNKYITKVLGKTISGYIDKNKHGQILDGLPIITLDEFKTLDDAGIIVAVGASLIDEVINLIREARIKNYITYLSCVGRD